MKDRETYTNGQTPQNRLISQVRQLVDNGSTMLSIAKRFGVNPGVVYRVYHGGDSPQPRRKLGIRKTNRHRLNIDCPPELKAQFELQRGEMSRADYLQFLVDLDSGELPY